MKKETHTCRGCHKQVPLVRAEVPFGLAGRWSVTVPALRYDCGSGCEDGAGVIFENPGQILATIAAAVVNKKTRIAPEEFRFLRGRLDMTAVDLAKHMGVTSVQISRWENGAAPIAGPADRLIRLMTVQHGGTEYDVHHLAEISGKPGAPLRLRLTRSKAGDLQVAA